MQLRDFVADAFNDKMEQDNRASLLLINCFLLTNTTAVPLLNSGVVST